VRRGLIAIGTVLSLAVSVFWTVYLVQYGLSGRTLTTQDIVVGAGMATVAVGAVVVLVRLYRHQSVGLLGGYVLVVGLGVTVLLAVPFLMGVLFVY
jgi:hypothetical protein